MLIRTAVALGLCFSPWVALPVHAKTPFTGADYSGSYHCTGKDKKEGEYSGKVTLERVSAQSTGNYGAYSFKLEVPGYGAYPGHAASNGTQMAIYFANTDPSTRDFGTGIATFRKNKAGKWTFQKYYYEPEFKNGNHGFEYCTQQ